MEHVMTNLYASTPEPLPFGPSLGIRTCFLRRERGNLLVYSTGTIESDVQEIEKLGGVARHYLNHRHEAGFAADHVARTFGAPLFCHENERRAVAETVPVAETFTKRHIVDDDFEVIPIPGHTPGATAFLWDTGEHRCLFTGDTVMIGEGEWVAAVLSSSDRDTYVESLELIRELDFDVLVPWAASAEERSYALTDREHTRQRIDAILERVRRGEDH